MANLTTVPSFLFPNGEESPIKVSFYNGSIELTQIWPGGIDANTIILSPEQVKPLLKEISKHQPEAEKILSKR